MSVKRADTTSSESTQLQEFTSKVGDSIQPEARFSVVTFPEWKWKLIKFMLHKVFRLHPNTFVMSFETEKPE